MARRCTKKQWDEMVEHALAVTPMPRDYDVQVRRTALGGSLEGDAELLCDTGRFVVRVHDDLTAGHSREVLIHELAHVLDWRPYTGWSTDHGPTFWIRYGEIYRAVHQVR